MKVAAFLASFCALLSSTASAWADEYFVATTGDDNNSGSEEAPFSTLEKANSVMAGGDTVWVRGGVYAIRSQLILSKSGTEAAPTRIWAYPGEAPVLDASQYVTSNPAVDVPVVLVTGSFMHLKGLEIGNAKVGASGDHSYSLVRTKNASNNTFELLDLHHGFGSGLFIDTGTGGNVILNCDSHDNYDEDGSQGDGQNGDGFGVHYQTTGPSTVIRGSRAWKNSDDGYDYIYQEVPVITEGNFAMKNGYGSSGNGNGFKMGSSETGVRHIVQHNVAWANKAAGFYANHSSGGNTWYNNSSYDNGTQYNMLAATFQSDGRTIATDGITLVGDKVHVMRNNVGYPNKNANMNGVDSDSNSWDLALSEQDAAFVSIDDTGCTGPRESDGGLPSACAFLRLTEQSLLIDAGVDVALPYAGDAPDLGAYEYGLSSSNPATGGTGAMGTGGDSSAGGTSGSGGSGGSPLTGSGGGELVGSGGTSLGAGASSTGGSDGAGATVSSGGAGAATMQTGGTESDGSNVGLGTGGAPTDPMGPAGEQAGGCAWSRGMAPVRHGSLSALLLLGLLANARRRSRQAS